MIRIRPVFSKKERRHYTKRNILENIFSFFRSVRKNERTKSANKTSTQKEYILLFVSCRSVKYHYYTRVYIFVFEYITQSEVLQILFLMFLGIFFGHKKDEKRFKRKIVELRFLYLHGL